MKNALYVLMFLLLISTVYAADSASLTSLSVTAIPGQSTSGIVTLTNTGNTTLNGSLSIVFSGSTGISAVLAPSSFTSLAPGASQSITVSVSVPSNNGVGTTAGTITANFVGATSGTATSAASVVVTSANNFPSFTVNDLEFGSSTQVRGQTSTQTLTINNNGNQVLTLNLASNLPSQYNVVFSQSLITVNAGTTASVQVTITVPLSQDSGRNQVSGGINITATNVAGISRPANVFVTAQNELEIYKVTVEVNNDGEEHSIRSGDTYDKDIKAGTPITLKVYVRNDFDSTNKIQIRDITGDIRSSGDLSIDESDDFQDLDYGDKDSVSVSTNIPSDASDSDRYDIDVTVKGRDENGAYHTDTYNSQIEVRRDTHEITIKSASVSPQTVKCNGHVTINAELDNSGRTNEDDVQMTIVSNDLYLNQRLYGMTLDVDDTLKKTYAFDINNNTAPGEYDIILTSFYNGNTDSDTTVLPLTVTACPATTTNNNANTNANNNGNNNVNSNVPTYPQVTPVGGSTPVYGASSFTDSTAYIVLLVAGVVLVLIVLIALLVKFVF